MSDGSSEAAVMPSLGFVRNPSVPDERHDDDARWVRLPIAPRGRLEAPPAFAIATPAAPALDEGGGTRSPGSPPGAPPQLCGHAE